MRGLILPLSVVLSPLAAMAAVQQGLAVLAPAYTAAAGLAPEAVGLVGGLSGLGSVWFFAATGAILPVLGPVRALIWACLLAAGAALLFLPASAWLIFLAAPLVGFGYAATAPAGSQILSAHTPRRLWGTLFSIRQSGVPAGAAVAGVLGAGLAAVADWRVGLAALAALPLLAALFLATRRAPFRPGPMEGRLRLRAVAAPGNLRRPFLVLAATPGLWRLVVASLGFAAVQGSAFTFLTTYLTDGVGLSLAMAGTLFATMQGASFLGRVAIGFLADRSGSTRGALLVLGPVSAGAAMLLTVASPTVPVAALFAGAIVIGASVATWNGLYLAEVAGLAEGTRVSEVTAAATFFTFLAYMATPPLFAAAVRLAGYDAAFFTVAALVLMTTLALLRRRGGGGRAR
ncbi:MAG: MFS transporter [Pseudomonadota bacterium]